MAQVLYCAAKDLPVPMTVLNDRLMEDSLNRFCDRIQTIVTLVLGTCRPDAALDKRIEQELNKDCHLPCLHCCSSRARALQQCRRLSPFAAPFEQPSLPLCGHAPRVWPASIFQSRSQHGDKGMQGMKCAEFFRSERVRLDYRLC